MNKFKDLKLGDKLYVYSPKTGMKEAKFIELLKIDDNNSGLTCEINDKTLDFVVKPESNVASIKCYNNVWDLSIEIVGLDEESVKHEFLYQQEVLYCGIKNLKITTL